MESRRCQIGSVDAMDYQALLQEICHAVAHLAGRGAVVDYIPALRRVDPSKFGISLLTFDGAVYHAGDAEERFSIQSIAKLFCFQLALRLGGDEIWSRVGREPSGTHFNSLVQLEYEGGIPRNPFINAGALVTLDYVMSRFNDPLTVIRDYVRVLAQEFSIDYDRTVARSERATGTRNAALAWLLKSHGNIVSDVNALLHTYCHLCALTMSCVELSWAFAFLANRGVSPRLREAIVTESQTQRINALMMTCGMYDSVGNFAYRVGLPAKSGVGGGIVAVLPGEYVVTVWSPGLDKSGNSLAGVAALQLLTQVTGRSVF